MSGNYRPRRRYGGAASAQRDQRDASEAGADSATRAKAGAGNAARVAVQARHGPPGQPAAPHRLRTCLKAVRDREAYANLLLPQAPGGPPAHRHVRRLAPSWPTAPCAARAPTTHPGRVQRPPPRKLDPPVLDILRLGGAPAA